LLSNKRADEAADLGASCMNIFASLFRIRLLDQTAFLILVLSGIGL